MLAIQNGGKGDGSRAKGAGKGKSKTTDAAGKQVGICYAYNNGEPCKSSPNPCPFAHVCQICEGPHPKGECPTKK